jgi:hypothetical protein
MFPKLLVLILAFGFTATALLCARQERLELSHRAADAHRRCNEEELRCWAAQAEIARRCGMEATRAAMNLAGGGWRPIGPPPAEEPAVMCLAPGPSALPASPIP